MKGILSGKMIEVLVGRVVDLEEGNETAAVTAVAMFVDCEGEEKEEGEEQEEKVKRK